jgi:hypothetical protein
MQPGPRLARHRESDSRLTAKPLARHRGSGAFESVHGVGFSGRIARVARGTSAVMQPPKASRTQLEIAARRANFPRRSTHDCQRAARL